MGRNLTNQISKRTPKLEKFKHTLELADQRDGTEKAETGARTYPEDAGYKGRRAFVSTLLTTVTKYQPNHLQVGEGLFSSPCEGLRALTAVGVAAGAGGGQSHGVYN